MDRVVYSVALRCESVLMHDSVGAQKREVYFVAEVAGNPKGKTPILQAGANTSVMLSGLGFSWDLQIPEKLTGLSVSFECRQFDPSGSDRTIGTLKFNAGGPWSTTPNQRTVKGAKFDLTYSLAVTMTVLQKSPVALVARQLPGSKKKNTLRAVNVAQVTLTEILGLYKPGYDDRAAPAPGTTRGSGYRKGYLSEDDRGRVFRNRTPDGRWKKDTQYLDLQVVIDPPTVRLPAGAKVVWSFQDPDDPSNDPEHVQDSASHWLDPNDYNHRRAPAAAGGDNDPNHKGKAQPRFEELDPKYALGNKCETLIDPSTRTSKVRFHVSDIAGDNFKIKAEVKADPALTHRLPAQTGVFSVWDRVDVEYVKMDSALELPVGEISQYYDMAFAQVDVSLKRIVSGASDLPEMGPTDPSAQAMCDQYSSKAAGEFTMEGQGGWFFIAAANRFVSAQNATILYEGDAHAHGSAVRLPVGTTLAGTPAVVRVFNPSTAAPLGWPKPNDRNHHTKFEVKRKLGRDLQFVPHDFHKPDNPDHAFLKASLTDYGIAEGAKIPIQVLSFGDEAMVVGGISPGGVDTNGKHYFGGRLIVFTRSLEPPDFIRTLCHELCHAFDNAHKCGNWDWVRQPRREACCMNYWFQFVLDDQQTRRPIAWSQNRLSAHLCAPHVRRMRDYHLQDNPGLGWP
jgi:hypothetical protein